MEVTYRTTPSIRTNCVNVVVNETDTSFGFMLVDIGFKFVRRTSDYTSFMCNRDNIPSVIEKIRRETGRQLVPGWTITADGHIV